MFVWRDIQTLVGFNGEMISYRNSLVKEVNFIFSPEFQKIKEDETIANIHQTNVTLRKSARDKIKDPQKKARVEIRLVEEALTPEPDFRAADLLIKYLDISIEDYGRDIFFDLRKKDTIYTRLLNADNYQKVFKFLEYFPEDEARSELKFLLRKSAESASYEGFLYLVKKLFVSPYNKLIKDEELREFLSEEFDKAESDKRTGAAEFINKFLRDDERGNRLKAMKALLERDCKKAVLYLEKIEHKSKLRDIIINCYWEEYKDEDKKIEKYLNAFNLAYYGGLEKEEGKNFVEHPASKLLEFYIEKPLNNASELKEAVLYAEYAAPREVRNILARRFISLVENNQVLLAVKLKKLFNVKFTPDEYDEEEKVINVFEGLIATKGIYGIPKGEENLLAALDFALVFDFGKKDIDNINCLLCKFYISDGDFEKAAIYYIADDKSIADLIENEIDEFLRAENYTKIYNLIRSLCVSFSIETIHNRQLELTAMLGEVSFSPDNIVKMIVIEDVFKLNILPKYIYSKLLNYCIENEQAGAQILTDLRIPLHNKIDSIMKIRIYRFINRLIEKDGPVSEAVSASYKDLLPPSIFDWIMYLFNVLFKHK